MADKFHIRMVGQSDIGRCRKNNQDSYFVDAGQGLAAVADGIGGRRGGDLASSLAIHEVRQTLLLADGISGLDAQPILHTALERANHAILSLGASRSELAGLGTTINSLVFSSGFLYLAHLGDSRTYRYENGKLNRLTTDHNVENLLRAQRRWGIKNVVPMAPPDALVRALGLTPQIQPDVLKFKLCPGQIYLCCSDGLSGYVKPDVIRSILETGEHDLEEVPQQLIDAANRAGGKDNITVVVARVDPLADECLAESDWADLPLVS